MYQARFQLLDLVKVTFQWERKEIKKTDQEILDKLTNSDKFYEKKIREQERIKSDGDYATQIAGMVKKILPKRLKFEQWYEAMA